MFENSRNCANKIILLSKQAGTEQNKTKKRVLLKKIEEQIQLIDKDLKEKATKKVTIDWIEKRKLLEELNIDESTIKNVYTTEKKKKDTNIFGALANSFFEPLSEKIISLSPKPSTYFKKKILESGLNMLSISYISIALLTSIIFLFLGTTLGVILFYTFTLWYGLFLGLLLSITSMGVFSLYPIYKARKRKKNLEEELPFFINHCAALAHAGVKTKDMFEIITITSYYKTFHIDCKRIINYIDVLNKTTEQSLKQTAEANPSGRTKEFLKELAKAIEEKKDIKLFLSEKAKESLKSYKKQNNFIKRYTNHWEDIHQSFSLKGYSFISLTVLAAILLLYWYHPSIDGIFISSLAGALFLLFIPLSLKIIIDIKRRQREEKQFLLLLQELKETKNLLKIETNFKELQGHIQKIKNQYKLGISKEKAWETFGKESKNPLIRATINMSLEAHKRGADFYTALYELGTSKILREVLKN